MTMRRVKTYDEKSYELAEYFLADEPALNTETNRHALASEIQECVEYFMRHPDETRV